MTKNIHTYITQTQILKIEIHKYNDINIVQIFNFTVDIRITLKRNSQQFYKCKKRKNNKILLLLAQELNA